MAMSYTNTGMHKRFVTNILRPQEISIPTTNPNTHSTIPQLEVHFEQTISPQKRQQDHLLVKLKLTKIKINTYTYTLEEYKETKTTTFRTIVSLKVRRQRDNNSSGLLPES